jgi:hypothetical protein
MSEYFPWVEARQVLTHGGLLRCRAPECRFSH